MRPEWGSLFCCHKCQGSEPEQAEDCSSAIAAGTTANIAAGAAGSLDRPVGFCCGGSGVWPLLPTPSEVADASLYCVRESTGAFLMTEKCSHTRRLEPSRRSFQPLPKRASLAIVMGMNEDTYKTDEVCVLYHLHNQWSGPCWACAAK